MSQPKMTRCVVDAVMTYYPVTNEQYKRVAAALTVNRHLMAAHPTVSLSGDEMVIRCVITQGSTVGEVQSTIKKYFDEFVAT